MAPTVWYRVRNLDEGRRFYREVLGFDELSVDFEERWSTLKRGEMEIGLSEGEPRTPASRTSTSPISRRRPTGCGRRASRWESSSS